MLRQSSSAVATSLEGPSLPSRGPIKREHYVLPITLDCAYQREKGCEIILATDEIAREEGFHHFGRLVTRSSFVTTATALLAITASTRKNPNSATLSGSEIKKLNFGGKQKHAAAKALANEVRTPTVLP